MTKIKFFSVVVALAFVFGACNKDATDQIVNEDPVSTSGVKKFVWADPDQTQVLYSYGQVSASVFAHFPSGGTQFNNEKMYAPPRTQGVFLTRDPKDSGNGWVRILFTEDALKMVEAGYDCEYSIGVRFKGSLNAVWSFNIRACVEYCKNATGLDKEYGILIDGGTMGAVTQIRFGGDLEFKCEKLPVKVLVKFFYQVQEDRDEDIVFHQEYVEENTSLLSSFLRAGFEGKVGTNKAEYIVENNGELDGDYFTPDWYKIEDQLYAQDWEALADFFGIAVCQAKGSHGWFTYNYDADRKPVDITWSPKQFEDKYVFKTDGTIELWLVPTWPDDDCVAKYSITFKGTDDVYIGSLLADECIKAIDGKAFVPSCKNFIGWSVDGITPPSYRTGDNVCIVNSDIVLFALSEDVPADLTEFTNYFAYFNGKYAGYDLSCYADWDAYFKAYSALKEIIDNGITLCDLDTYLAELARVKTLDKNFIPLDPDLKKDFNAWLLINGNKVFDACNNLTEYNKLLTRLQGTYTACTQGDFATDFARLKELFGSFKDLNQTLVSTIENWLKGLEDQIKDCYDIAAFNALKAQFDNITACNQDEIYALYQANKDFEFTAKPGDQTLQADIITALGKYASYLSSKEAGCFVGVWEAYYQAYLELSKYTTITACNEDDARDALKKYLEAEADLLLSLLNNLDLNFKSAGFDGAINNGPGNIVYIKDFPVTVTLCDGSTATIKLTMAWGSNYSNRQFQAMDGNGNVYTLFNPGSFQGSGLKGVSFVRNGAPDGGQQWYLNAAGVPTWNSGFPK